MRWLAAAALVLSGCLGGPYGDPGGQPQTFLDPSPAGDPWQRDLVCDPDGQASPPVRVLAAFAGNRTDVAHRIVQALGDTLGAPMGDGRSSWHTANGSIDLRGDWSVEWVAYQHQYGVAAGPLAADQAGLEARLRAVFTALGYPSGIEMSAGETASTWTVNAAPNASSDWIGSGQAQQSKFSDSGGIYLGSAYERPPEPTFTPADATARALGYQRCVLRAAGDPAGADGVAAGEPEGQSLVAGRMAWVVKVGWGEGTPGSCSSDGSCVHGCAPPSRSIYVDTRSGAILGGHDNSCV